MKKRIIIILFIAGVLAAGGVYYYSFYLGAKHQDPMKSDDKIVINATDLFALYVKDEAKANTMYLDSVISVTGKIENIELNDGRYTLTLASGDSTGTVICEIDIAENDKVKALNKGAMVNLVGFCNGYLMDVQLDRCKLND